MKRAFALITTILLALDGRAQTVLLVPGVAAPPNTGATKAPDSLAGTINLKSRSPLNLFYSENVAGSRSEANIA
jgi:hypothetical protein